MTLVACDIEPVNYDHGMNSLWHVYLLLGLVIRVLHKQKDEAVATNANMVLLTQMMRALFSRTGLRSEVLNTYCHVD